MKKAKEVVQDGEKKIYLKDGTLFWQGHYVKGKLHGESKTFFPDGSLASSCNYIHGKKEGQSIFYRKDKTLFCKKNFAKGVLQGLQEYYHLEGSLKAKLEYVDGLLKEVELFYPDGKKMRKISLKKGKRHGKDLMWEETGILRFELEYEMAKCIKKIVQDPIAIRYEL